MARPRKSLGQNFLVDPDIQIRIVEALQPLPSDAVLEVGPGRGALTTHLAQRVNSLVAVELDDQLAARLATDFHNFPNVRIVHDNILNVHPADFTRDVASLKVIGNIPYNITSPLIFHLLERDHRPDRLVLMVQKEVATRIAAPPGSRDFGALSIGVQAVASVQRLFHVPRGAFRPVPNVDSTVLLISPIRPFPLSEADEADLRSLTRAAFQRRRKQFQTILRTAPEYALARLELARIADRTGIDFQRRPESLSVHEFIDLARSLRNLDPPSSASPP
ncbi:MAG: 16S rRNA (adenine(1518)-N(6)/adenine(1519)-N(6))-dimethyltransferase RsmA [Longimicrobiales bacterium]